MNQIEEQRLREKLEVLDGSRAKDRQGSAVRVIDLISLLKIGQMQATPAAGSAPTKAEYDALVKDVQRLHGRLDEVATALQGKLL